MQTGHSVGITKGQPIHQGRCENGCREPLKHWKARWHFTCSCGETGEDMTAEAAQSDALSHAVGHTVRPRRVVRTFDKRPGGNRVQAGYELQ